MIAGPGDTIAHAQLSLSGDLLRLGDSPDDRFATTTPDKRDGAYTQTLNVCVPDPDAHHARARAAGAVILEGLGDKSYGARGDIARDLQGFV